MGGCGRLRPAVDGCGRLRAAAGGRGRLRTAADGCCVDVFGPIIARAHRAAQTRLRRPFARRGPMAGRGLMARLAEVIGLGPATARGGHVGAQTSHPGSHRSIGNSTLGRALGCELPIVRRDLGLCWGRLKHQFSNGFPAKKNKSPDPSERSHRRQQKPRQTAHAFRMTLVAQGKLPQIIIFVT